MNRVEPFSRWKMTLWQQVMLLTVTYAFSRALLFLMSDISFDLSGLEHFWQLLDLRLLERDLLSSLFYLHSQPPIFNLFTGLVLKLFPESYPIVFQFTFYGLSLLAYWALYRAIVCLQLSTVKAYLLATLFMLLPSTLLYENWFSYTWLVSCFLGYSAYMLIKFQITGRIYFLMVFFALLVVVCWTRSLFHLVYVVAISILVLIFAGKTQRLKILSLALVATVLVGALYVKNLVVFDFFGASSWAGMSFWKMTKCQSEAFSSHQKQLAEIENFSPMGSYEFAFESGWLNKPELDHPALNQIYKSSGHVNMNHQGYIPVADAYGRISVICLKENPTAYLIRTIGAWGVFSKPSWEYFFLEARREKIQLYLDVVTLQSLRFFIENRVLGLPRLFDFPLTSLLLIPLTYALITVVYIIGLFQVLRGKRPKESMLLDTFLVATMWYVGVIGNSLEYGENNRFRVCAGFLIYLAAIHSLFKLRHGIAKLQQRRSKS